jgi:MoaE-MoaD fusion protein
MRLAVFPGCPTKDIISYPMKIKVLFFGLAHDLTGFEEEEAEVPESENLAGLCRQYQTRFPRLAEISRSLLVSVNQNISDLSTPLNDGDEVAFLPPVSGGSCEDLYHIRRERITARELTNMLKAPDAGAVVVFEGVVRNHSRGQKTLYLEYEAYTGMAIRMMKEIGDSAKRQFPIDRIGMLHRVGRVEIGETSVVIVVTSAHRQAAFEACRYSIDELKRKVPIWKKEYFQEGAVWAEGEGLEQSLASSLA